jgi:ABC-type bacteriocin/lantibiotic exporter with double-glycine peptidase domain
MALLMVALSKMSKKYQNQAHIAEGAASTFLEQCFSGIRVVQTFDMARALMQRFGEQILRDAERSSSKRAAIQTMESGLQMAIFFIQSGVSFIYGSRLIEREGYNLGQVVAVSDSIRL